MILDCTLRDGGYHTNWEFDDDLVREIVSTLDVDYIELEIVCLNELLNVLAHSCFFNHGGA